MTFFFTIILLLWCPRTCQAKLMLGNSSKKQGAGNGGHDIGYVYSTNLPLVIWWLCRGRIRSNIWVLFPLTLWNWRPLSVTVYPWDLSQWTGVYQDTFLNCLFIHQNKIIVLDWKHWVAIKGFRAFNIYSQRDLVYMFLPTFTLHTLPQTRTVVIINSREVELQHGRKDMEVVVRDDNVPLRLPCSWLFPFSAASSVWFHLSVWCLQVVEQATMLSLQLLLFARLHSSLPPLVFLVSSPARSVKSAAMQQQ